jgi:hypothetical protein
MSIKAQIAAKYLDEATETVKRLYPATAEPQIAAGIALSTSTHLTSLGSEDDSAILEKIVHAAQFVYPEYFLPAE